MNFLLCIYLATSAFLLSRIILKDELKNIIYTPVHVLLGLMIYTQFYLIKEKLGISIDIFYIIVSLPFVLWFLRKKRRIFEINDIEVTNQFAFIGGILLVFIMFFLPVAIQAVMMSIGEYPKVFFNVDTAFFMQFVYEFIDQNQYPPYYRLSSADGFNYHYGSMATAALISEFTSIKAHKIFLGFFPILLSMSIILVAFKILKNEYRTIPKSLTILITGVFLTSGIMYRLPYWRPKSVLYEIINFNQLYFAWFPQLPSYIGLFIALLLILCNQNFHNLAYKILSVVLLALIPIFKGPYMPILGMGVGTYAIYLVFYKKNFSAILVPIAGAILMAANYLVFTADVDSVGAFQVTTDDLKHFIHHRSLRFTIPLHLSLICLLLIFFHKKVFYVINEKMYAFSFVFPFILAASLIKIDNWDSFQLYTLLPIFTWFLVLLLFFQHYSNLFNSGKIILTSCLLIFPVLPLISSVSYIHRLIMKPQLGHEYVSNESLADILKKVPIKESRIVVSDNRYPAENYRRENRQYQTSGIMGHYGFNSELGLSTFYSIFNNYELKDRLVITELLHKKTWDNYIVEIAIRNNITHLIVNKNFIYPTNIPLKKQYENRDFMLYRF